MTGSRMSPILADPVGRLVNAPAYVKLGT
jgi:hypothetical protein